jgi:acyl dehydratase
MPMPAEKEQIVRPHGPTTSELCVRLAGLLNDYNPAHYDLTFATEIGMPGVIAPGTLLQGWILADMAELLKTDEAVSAPHRFSAIDLRFRTPVFLKEQVLITYDWQVDHVAVTVTASADPETAGRIVATGTVHLATAGTRS